MHVKIANGPGTETEMKGDKKTKEELMNELGDLRRQIAELIKSEAERRQTEEALCESEERYHRLFNSINDPVFVHYFTENNMPGLFVEVNDAACRQYGYSRDELLKMRPMDIDAPEGLAVIPDAMQKLVYNGFATWEGMHLTRDGRKIPVEISNVLFNLHGDQLILSLVRVISDRKKSEEALRSSREFISSILDTVDEGFIVIDRDYRIISANKAYCRQVSMSVGEITGRHCHEISHQSVRPCYEAGEECAVRHSFEKGEPHVCFHKHQDKDGHVIYVETKSYPLRDAAGNVTSVIETINNITDKHLLEEQILRTQKLEAVGLLAGGIAHDFNNLLQAVFGSISMAKMFSDNNGKAYQMLEGAERDSGRTDAP